MAEQQKKPPVAKPKAVAAAPAKTTRPVAAKRPAATAKPVTAKAPAVAAPAAKPAIPATAAITVAKPVKAKLVSKSYTMSAADHALLSEIKKSTQQSGIKIKKGELLSAALGLLAKLSPTELEKLLKKA